MNTQLGNVLHKEITYRNPCSQFLSSNVDNSNVPTASIFLNNDRLKEWKPIVQPDDHENYLYCYFNGDEKLFENQECDKNSFFKITNANESDYKFVNSMFTDTKADTTEISANKKCVVKFDKENLKRPDNVNTFWNSLNTVNCESEKLGLMGDINVLEGDIKSIYSNIKIQEDKIKLLKQQNGEMNELKKKTNDLRYIFDNNEADFRKQDKLRTTTVSKLHFQKNQKIAIRSNKESKINDLINKLRVISENISIKVKEVEEKKKKKTRLTDELDRLVKSVAVLRKDVNKMKEDYEYKQKELVRLQTDIRILNIQTVKIQREIKVLINEIDEIIKTKTINQAEKNVKQTSHDTKEEEFNICKSDYNKLVVLVNNLETASASLVKNLAEQKQQIDIVTKELANMEKNIKEWIPYPHYNCADDIRARNVTIYQNKILSTQCQEKIKHNSTQLTSLLNTEYQDKISRLRECTNNKFKTVPIQREFAAPIPKLQLDNSVPFLKYSGWAENWLVGRSKHRASWNGKNWEKTNFNIDLNVSLKGVIYNPGRYDIYRKNVSSLLGSCMFPSGKDLHDFVGGGDRFVSYFISPSFRVPQDTVLNFSVSDVDDDIRTTVYDIQGNIMGGSISANKQDNHETADIVLYGGGTYRVLMRFYQHDKGTRLYFSKPDKLSLKGIEIPIHIGM